MMYFLSELAYNLFWLVVFPIIFLALALQVNRCIKYMDEKNFHETKGYHRRYPKGRYRTHV